MNNLDWAKYYLKQGFSVIPVGANKNEQHGLKAPLISSWLEYQNRLATEEEITGWWNNWPEAKIGIITGKISCLVVVDIDNPLKFKELGISLPETPKAKTGKGLHFYYKYPEIGEVKSEKIFNGDIQVGDLKSDGGYVVAPPSHHHNHKDEVDGEYEWIDPLGTVEMVVYNMWINSQRVSGKEKFDSLLTGAYQGNRNDGATVFIGSIIKKLPQNEWATKAWPALIEWNKNNKPPMPDSELAVIYKSICSKEILSKTKSNQSELDKYREKFHPISCGELQKKTPEPFPYLVDGIIPEKAITVIAGDTGCGKSLFLLKMADSISRGATLFGQFKTKKTNVLYLDMEMNEEDYIYRTKILCEPYNNLFISYGTKFKFDDPINTLVLTEFIRNNEIGLIIFDTLSKIHAGEENDNTDMTKVMEAMLDFIENLKISVVLIHHHNKNQLTTGIGKGRGASAIADNCASYLEVKSQMIRDEFGEEVLSMDIEQHKRRRSSTGKFGLNIKFFPEDKAVFTYREEAMAQQDILAPVKQAVINFIKSNPGLSESKIKDNLFKMNFKKSNVKDAIDTLVKLNQIEIQSGSHSANLHFLKDDKEQLNLDRIIF